MAKKKQYAQLEKENKKLWACLQLAKECFKRSGDGIEVSKKKEKFNLFFEALSELESVNLESEN